MKNACKVTHGEQYYYMYIDTNRIGIMQISLSTFFPCWPENDVDKRGEKEDDMQ